MKLKSIISLLLCLIMALSAVSCSCVSEPNVPKVKNWSSIF